MVKELALRIGDYNPWQEIAAFEGELDDLTSYGASSLFIGRMRDQNLDSKVFEMYMEHYPQMTENVLHELVDQALANKSKTGACLLLHRIGRIHPGQTIVLVGVWSGHRTEAITATSEIIESLKKLAPFWKQETLAGSKRWIEPIIL